MSQKVCKRNLLMMTVTALKRPARSGVAEDKPETGFGKYGTAAPLTAHRGRSRPAERNSEGKTILDAVTKACQEVLTSFIGMHHRTQFIMNCGKISHNCSP